MEIEISRSAQTRTLPLRDTRGRFMAGPATAAKGRRVRVQPSRDARGRFVSFPTTNTPSGYVFCADGYRIPGEAEVTRIPTAERTVLLPQTLPPSRVVRQRQLGRRDEVVTWLVMVLILVAVGWYGLALPLPHH
jgi:hypothetical protein